MIAINDYKKETNDYHSNNQRFESKIQNIVQFLLSVQMYLNVQYYSVLFHVDEVFAVIELFRQIYQNYAKTKILA